MSNRIWHFRSKYFLSLYKEIGWKSGERDFYQLKKNINNRIIHRLINNCKIAKFVRFAICKIYQFYRFQRKFSLQLSQLFHLHHSFFFLTFYLIMEFDNFVPNIFYLYTKRLDGNLSKREIFTNRIKKKY